MNVDGDPLPIPIAGSADEDSVSPLIDELVSQPYRELPCRYWIRRACRLVLVDGDGIIARKDHIGREISRIFQTYLKCTGGRDSLVVMIL